MIVLLKISRVVFAGCLFLSPWAGATIVTVPGNFSTIAAAVTGAPDGSTILVSDGVYGFINAPNLRKNLTIKSVNGPANAIISGNNSTRLLRVENSIPGGDPEKNLVFEGFTFRDGRGVDGTFSPITIADARPVFINCIFENNRAFDKGGAVLVYGTQAHPVFIDCIFRNNRSDRFGGAALINGGNAQATFKRCRFEGNTTRTPNTSNFSEGGALKFSQGGGRVIDSVFTSNSTAYAGGAIMILNQFSDPTEGVVEIRGCVFEGNLARPVPGASPANPPPSEGGGIMVEDRSLAIVEGCLFTNNVAATGAGIMVYRGKLRVENSVFDGNVADGANLLGAGGAIGINSFDAVPPNRPEAQVWLSDVMIRNNVAPVGGGIFAQGDYYWGVSEANRGFLYLQRVVVENNRATTANNSYGNGGGLFFNLMHVTATNLYVLNNRAENLGGGWAQVQNSYVRLADSYVVGNTADWTDAEFHAPQPPAPVFVNTVRAYNGGAGSANLSHLVAIPSRSYDRQAYLTYLNLPFGSPSLAPVPGGLPNRGGYAAGTVLISGVSTTTTFTLTSQHAAQSATVTRSFRALGPRAFNGITPVLPAKIEAERFDTGGNLLAYHDRTIPNEGGAFRPSERVDISPSGSASGGFFVGWMEAGEWMDYSFYSPGGSYQLTTRLAAPAAGGQYRLFLNGSPIVPGSIAVPTTGGWAAWQELDHGIVNVPEGFHTLSFFCVRGGFNLDAFEFVSLQPTLALSATRLVRSVKTGKAAVPRSLQIRNSGSDNLAFSVSANVPWINLSTNAGTSAGEWRQVQIGFNPAGLGVGSHTGVVTIASAEAVNSPRSVLVILRVRPDQYVVNDVDGDGTSDLGVYFPPGGNWYVFRSALGFMTDQFGFTGTIQVSGDFDGDGRGDLCLYHPPSGTWYIFGSQRGFYTEQFGFAGTIPLAGDFDGDGVSDLGVYHPPTGMWYIFGSQRGFFTDQFGFEGTIPVSGDFDGDGISDLCVYHPPSGMWYIFGSQRRFFTEQFGFAGTIPLSGDFDGDGTSDLGVYHPPTGMWYIFGSQRGFYTDQFGFAGTIPVPGDFDGDGKADLAVYFPPGGNWYIFRSSDGFLTDQFGFAGTVPLGATVMSP